MSMRHCCAGLETTSPSSTYLTIFSALSSPRASSNSPLRPLSFSGLSTRAAGSAFRRAAAERWKWRRRGAAPSALAGAGVAIAAPGKASCPCAGPAPRAAKAMRAMQPPHARDPDQPNPASRKPERTSRRGANPIRPSIAKFPGFAPWARPRAALRALGPPPIYRPSSAGRASSPETGGIEPSIGDRRTLTARHAWPLRGLAVSRNMGKQRWLK